MSAHAEPVYCPYCGEEDLRPWGETAGEFRCGSCLRVWRLKLVGTTAPDLTPVPTAAAPLEDVR